ncbi:MAG: two-component sensor histidine kinase, partial [Gammaproteobacteria bacterium]
MAHSSLRRLLPTLGPPTLVLLLLASLVIMSNATQDSAQFSETYSALLLLNAVGLVGLATLIGWNLFRLLAQVRRGEAGARLTARMVLMFALLAVTPVSVVYYFSLQVLHRGIDSWFDVRIEKALEDALDLSRSALGVRMRELLKQSEIMAADLLTLPETELALQLDDARRLSGASELLVMNSQGRIVASSSIDATVVVPHRPPDAVMMQARQSGSYIALDPIEDAGLHIRVAINVGGNVLGTESLLLQALFPVAERMATLADSVQEAFAQYRELAYLRKPLKTSFTLTLSLVLLLSLLTSVWAAFFSARRVVAPLRDLAQGTRSVAAGDYETQLPQAGTDEVGFLVQSFNQMTQRLSQARDETRRSQQQVEEQRGYLEAVLTRLSSGVITLDHGRLVTTNAAASQILGCDLESRVGEEIGELSRRHPELQTFADTIIAHFDSGKEDWTEELTVSGAAGHRVIICRGTGLGGSDDAISGHVIVFDDISELIRAQRNAAWSEVARRLAHEIKNPLTPIQLSAERLRRKYLKTMTGDEAATLDRLTNTIVQQVESMKSMVNAFSDYARSPEPQPRLTDINELINDIVEMYRSGDTGHGLTTRLDPKLRPMEADPDRLRQVLHNLIKNALEAQAKKDEPYLAIETRYVNDKGAPYAEIIFTDHGSGFPEDVLAHAFEPYTTTKTKGNGLGLAIVKKIV